MAVFAAAAALLLAAPSSAYAEADHAAIAKAALNEVIRPGYADLAKATNALNAKAGALCANPSAATVLDVKTAFANTVAAWSRMEIFRFGPIIQDQRYERMFY